MSLKNDKGDVAEKQVDAAPPPSYEPTSEGQFASDPENNVAAPKENNLHQDLKGRHMQMIAMQVQHSEPLPVY
jgi:amino acid permease